MAIIRISELLLIRTALGINAQHYRELALNYSNEINKKTTFGDNR